MQVETARAAIKWLAVAIVITGGLAWYLVADATERDRHQRAAFVKTHPCPASGKAGRCPGYVVDHVVPLCAGGKDHPSNMQWQSVGDAKVKDREERAMCAKSRR